MRNMRQIRNEYVDSLNNVTQYMLDNDIPYHTAVVMGSLLGKRR